MKFDTIQRQFEDSSDKYTEFNVENLWVKAPGLNFYETSHSWLTD